MKNKLLQFFPYFLLVCVFLTIYKNWFLATDIIGGDWPYYFPQAISDFHFPPLSWVSWRGNGFGGIDITYSLHIFEQLLILGTTLLHIPWNIIYRVFWFGGFLLLTILSSFYLFKIIFPTSRVWHKITAAFIYSANTYVLLVASGGQMGYALGYACAPLVCAQFIKSFSLMKNVEIVKNIIFTSFVLGFLLMIDIRVAYIVLIIVGLYYLYCVFYVQKERIKPTGVLLMSLLFAVLLNLSWILPLVSLKQNIVGEVSQTYTSVSSLQFFSFADFSHTLGLLHPNWPENVFGKVYFMQWEFLVLPLLAFSSLLFIHNNPQRKNVLFFAFVGLIGVFLAKGANDPLGGIYIWFFEHVPGFVMFRDPTKWYVLIALSYSILIPFSIGSLYTWLNSKFKVQNAKLQFKIKNFIPGLFIITVFLFLLFLIRAALFGQLGGTLQKHTVSQDYIQLAAYLDMRHGFFRTLWLPRQSRFTYSTSDHRIVEALTFFNASSSAQLIADLHKQNTQQQLITAGIKYVIVPYDSLSEIFKKDRKYNPQEYEYIVEELRKISWLHEITGFGKIIVFETTAYNDHFFLLSDGILNYKENNTANYIVHVNSKEKNTVVFSENYNPFWKAEINGQNVSPIKTREGYMQLVLPQKGSYEISISFTEQQYYLIGFIISIVFLGLLIIVFVVLQYTDFFHYLKNTV